MHYPPQREQSHMAEHCDKQDGERITRWQPPQSVAHVAGKQEQKEKPEALTLILGGSPTMYSQCGSAQHEQHKHVKQGHFDMPAQRKGEGGRQGTQRHTPERCESAVTSTTTRARENTRESTKRQRMPAPAEDHRMSFSQTRRQQRTRRNSSCTTCELSERWTASPGLRTSRRRWWRKWPECTTCGGACCAGRASR